MAMDMKFEANGPWLKFWSLGGLDQIEKGEARRKLIACETMEQLRDWTSG